MSELTDPPTADGCGVTDPCFSVARCFEICGEPRHSQLPQHRLVAIPNMLTHGACLTKHLPTYDATGRPHPNRFDNVDFIAPDTWGYVLLHELHQLCFTHRHDNGEMMDVLRRWLVELLKEEHPLNPPTGHTPGTHRLHPR